MKSLRVFIVRSALCLAFLASAGLVVGFSGCSPKKTTGDQTSDLDSLNLKKFLGDFIGFLKGKSSKTSQELDLAAANTVGKIEAMKAAQKPLPRTELDEINELAKDPENNIWKLLEMTKGKSKTRQHVNKILDAAEVPPSTPEAELKKGSMECNLIDTYVVSKPIYGRESFGLISRERDPAQTAATLLSKKVKVAGLDVAKFNSLVDEASTVTRDIEFKAADGILVKKEIKIFTINNPFKPNADNSAQGAMGIFNNIKRAGLDGKPKPDGISKIALIIGVSSDEVAVTFDGISPEQLKQFLEDVKVSLAYTQGRPTLSSTTRETSMQLAKNRKSLIIPNHPANQKYIDTLFKMFGATN